jgi:hypothetical protein
MRMGREDVKKWTCWDGRRSLRACSASAGSTGAAIIAKVLCGVFLAIFGMLVRVIALGVSILTEAAADASRCHRVATTTCCRHDAVAECCLTPGRLRGTDVATSS